MASYLKSETEFCVCLLKCNYFLGNKLDVSPAPAQSVIECRTVKRLLLIMVVELYHIAKSRSPRVLWLYLELEALYGDDDRFPELKLTREVIQ